MVRNRSLLNACYDVWRTGHTSPSHIAALRRARLGEIIEFAREHSPYYRQLYARLPVGTSARGPGGFSEVGPGIDSLQQLQVLPPVTKPELMANFDDWVTDPAVAFDGVGRFVADKSLVGRLYLDRYAVWSTSGITGRPGIFLHDRDALAVYGAMLAVRGWLAWTTPRLLWTFLRRGGRVATIISTGGHFAAVGLESLIHNLYPRQARRSRLFSALAPLPSLVRLLNEFQPAVLLSYPTMITLLAKEQVEGRLDIHPAVVSTAGEWLSGSARAQIGAAFNCPVRDAYASSEFMGIAFACGHPEGRGWLHVNSDRAILEPVDENYRPVPPGHASRTVLLTNLANHVQPIIRYDLGDSITMRPGPCPCGSPLPAIQVEGRRDEILYLQARDGKVVPLLPRALATLIGEVPGVHRFQAIQTGPDMMSVRLEGASGSDEHQVWERLAGCLHTYLSTQGLPLVRVERAPERPRQDPASGKFRQVWAENESVWPLAMSEHRA